jgi:hypothetical protein
VVGIVVVGEKLGFFGGACCIFSPPLKLVRQKFWSNEFRKRPNRHLVLPWRSRC